MKQFLITKEKKLIGTIKLPSQDRRALLDFKRIVKKKFGSQIKEIRLFGSKARGDWHKESDIDVLVVLKSATDDQMNFIYDTVMFLCGEYGVYLSVKVFSEKEFNQYQSIPTIFTQRILKEGIKV